MPSSKKAKSHHFPSLEQSQEPLELLTHWNRGSRFGVGGAVYLFFALIVRDFATTISAFLSVVLYKIRGNKSF